VTAATPSFTARIGDYFRLVRFSHSVFALPFALMGAWIAAGGAPRALTLLLVLGACVAARTAAMAFNRLVDAEIDKQNPRTRARELPAGRLRPAGVAALVAVSAAAFVACAFALNPLCGRLSFAVLAVLLAYSFTKRFTLLCHLWLGASLALAPLGAWLAVRGGLEGDLAAPLILSATVLTWVAGFDLIYACQDTDFDREARLHSVPARLGVPFALALSSALHAATVALLVLFAWQAGLSWIFGLAIVAAAGALSSIASRSVAR